VIFVMNDGQIVERGTHESLLARNGLYAMLCEIQFGGQTLRRASASA
jgi:ABC-type multidrug transport system fused ATPase/permease subunit